MIGSGVFLLFGAIARRGAAAGMGGDPVPQALLITGIVVAFSATAIAVTVLLRLYEETGTTTLASVAAARGGPGTEPAIRPARDGRGIDDARRTAAAGRRAGSVRGVSWPVSCSAGAARSARRMVTIVAGLAVAIAAAPAMTRSGEPLVYLLGGWAPPLGIALRADGLSIVMMLAVAVVIAGIGIYARGDFGTPPGVTEARAPLVYWLLLLAVWGSLNLVFLSGDLFTLYVALELLTFAGVPLVCLDGKGETLRAALRYLIYALAGSLLYLLGVVLLYGECGTLDIPLLAERIHPSVVTSGRRRADDDGAPRQDRAVPVAPVAAACPCGGASRRQRRAVGAGGQGIVLHRHPVVVRRGARASRARGGAARWPDSAPRRSCSAASSRCGRSG